MSSEAKNQTESTQQISPTNQNMNQNTDEKANISPTNQNMNQNIDEKVKISVTNQNIDEKVKISLTNNQNFSGANAVALCNLKLYSELINCPNCNYVGNSMVTTKCNCSNFCCCCCFGPIFWICFQLCRNKALSCKDADHRCPKCGTLLAHYEAC